MVPESSDFHIKAPPDKGASCFIYPATDTNLDFFADALGNGSLVAIPTETVYGLAGLALDQDACRRIFTVKGRPLVDPLIVHISDMKMLQKIAWIPAELERLASAFWPGPLTVILNKKPVVPDLVTAGKSTVAVRIPRHPAAHGLITRLGQPVAAPSANPFGYISPTCAEHVADSFGSKVPYIIDGGRCEVGLESTILDLSVPHSPTILRPGAISPDCIGRQLGIPVSMKRTSLAIEETASAPGTYAKHYSPQTSLSLFDAGKNPIATPSTAVIYIKRPVSAIGGNVFWLTENGSIESAAQSLYSLLRQVDGLGFDHIQCEMPDPNGNGFSSAVRDRLARAAAK